MKHRKYWFPGWWEESDKKDSTEPWEEFRIVLHGQESGETIDSADEIDAILKVCGYRIILEKVHD